MPSRFQTWFQKLETRKHWGLLVQFVKFGLVGVVNTLLSLGIYWFCLYVLHWNYQIANVVSFLISVINAYFGNRSFVFHSARDFTLPQHVAAFGKTLASYGFTFLLNTGLLTLLVEGLGVSEGLAPLLCLVVTIPLNFLLNKYWTFSKKRSSVYPGKENPEPEADRMNDPRT